MKKVLFLAFAASLIASASNAQEGMKTKNTAWGFTLGLNGSNLRTTGEATDWKTGLVAGFFVTFKVDEAFSIQPQFLYSSMGAKYSTNGSDNSLRLNYFSLPVLAQYKITERLAVLAGPQIDVLIAAKTKSGNAFSKVSDSYKEDSYNVTGGLAFWPSHCFGLTVRYIYGLNNVSLSSNPEMKNQGVQLTAAVKL